VKTKNSEFINMGFKEVMVDLLAATHCHGCGNTCPVTLVGYVGRYCRKGCWNKLAHIGGCDCQYCERRASLSKVISVYHRPYYNSMSPTRFVWPMGPPCTNPCIMTCQTIPIPGYNRQ
jgi:hypothetical protein